jgi:anti-sigma factor RsiW
MLDFLRNLTKSAAEKRQETLSAYVDDALSPRARRRFETQLTQDADLQAEVEQQQALKETLRQLPSRRVPRNFTLDPALYGRPERQPLVQFYPALRTATVLAAFFFVFAVVAGLLTTQSMSAPFTTTQSEAESDTAAESVAMEEPVAVEAAPMEGEAAAEAPEIPVLTTVPLPTQPIPDAGGLDSVDTDEEAPAEEAEAEEPEAVTAVPEAAEFAEDATINTATVDEEAGDTGAETAVPTTTATPTALPTPTRSQLPRPATPTLAPDRVEETGADDVAPADETQSRASATAVAQIAVTAEVETEPGPTTEGLSPTATNPLGWIQIGLAVLFLVLLAVTVYTRRRL